MANNSYIKEILYLLTPRERKTLLFLILSLIVTGTIETFGVASIGPFMAVATNPSIVESNRYLSYFYDFIAPSSYAHFVFIVGLMVMIILGLSNLISVLVLWNTQRFLYLKQHRISERILIHYLSQDYIYFLERNTSELIKNIFMTVNFVVAGIFMPAMQAASRIFVAIGILTLLVFLNPTLAFTVSIVIGGSYMLIYLAARKALSHAGDQTALADKRRYQAASEALSGIREIKLFHSEKVFIHSFSYPSHDYARHQTTSDIIVNSPRYALEIVAFGGVLIIMFNMMRQHGGDFSQAFPFVALYVFSAYRIMPAIQLVFISVSRIRFNKASLDILVGELRRKPNFNLSPGTQPLSMQKELRMIDVHFSYNNGQPVLRGVSLSVNALTTVGIVGASGSGKTTIVDLLLGLLSAQSGQITIDGKELTPQYVRTWQERIGYVPQQIYLLDSSIAANIAFGVLPNGINLEKLQKAVKKAHLEQFIQSLPDGFNTIVGERGVRLSGGERQRIGIARALYRDPDIIIFDEATNALDNITEAAVVDAINEIGHSKTIIMIAHRLATVMNCDIIYFLEQGEIVASGTFEELLQSSSHFQKLVEASNSNRASI